MSNTTSNTLMAWRLLYCTYVFIPIAAGLDKFFNLLANWSLYLNENIPSYLGVTSTTVMQSVGAIEIIAGLLVFYKPRLGGYVVCAWLIAVSVDLVTMGYHTHAGSMTMVHYDIAVRDIGLAVGAYVLALLSKALGK